MIRYRLPWNHRLVLAFLLFVSASTRLAGEGPGLTARPLPAAAVDAIPALLDATAKQKLMTTGSYSSFSEGQPKVDLCPDKVAGANIVRTLTASHPTIGVQSLVVAAMPAGLMSRPDRNLVLYNLMHQFRTMEGLQYFSSTHHEVRTLFTTSRVVRATGDRSDLADPRYFSIEPSHDLYLVQDDTTFGKNLYLVTVKGNESGSVELTMSNVERVWWGLVPVLGPDALKLTMVIQTSADGKFLYFYGNVGIRATKIFGMEEQVRTSFYHRVIALYSWFARQASDS